MATRLAFHNRPAGKLHMRMDDEVTASSIMGEWSAAQTITLRSTVYRKVFRKVDDVFKNWMGSKSPEEGWLGGDRQSAFRSMDRLKGNEGTGPLIVNPTEFDMRKNMHEETDQMEEALEMIKNDEDDDAGPDHFIFALAYADAAPENVLAVAKAEVTFKLDENVMLTKAALQQKLLPSVLSAVHIVQQEFDDEDDEGSDIDDDSDEIENVDKIDRYVEVVYVTDLVAKPTAMQKESGAELLKAIVDWAALSGRLVAFYPGNQEMIEYYKEIGFELINPELHDRMVYTGDRKGKIAKRENPEGSEDTSKRPLLLDFVGS